LPGGAPESNNDEDPMVRHMSAQLAKSRNNLRQQQLVADTTKLLELATELKTEVDKSNKDTLSLAVVKKAEEIEKLAKSVKEKMRNGQ
jgi:type VI protein secretion system component VasF